MYEIGTYFLNIVTNNVYILEEVTGNSLMLYPITERYHYYTIQIDQVFEQFIPLDNFDPKIIKLLYE